MRPLYLFLCIALLSGPTLFGQAPKAKFSLDHFKDYELATNPQLSPDGSKVLYSRQWINLMEDRRETDLWIVNADGSKNRFFLTGSNGLWSPDGTRVAFTKAGEPEGTQIFVKFLGEEGEPTQITKLEKSPSGMTWSPDGKYLAFTMHVDDDVALRSIIPAAPEGAKWTKAPKVVDQVQYRRDRVGFLENGYQHIFIVPAEGGTARQLTSGDWNHGGKLSWSPDGQRIYFTSLRIAEAEYAYRESQIYSVEVATGAITQITSRKGNESDVTVSPDGKKIAFVGSNWTENFYHSANLFVANADGSGLQNLTEKLDRSPGNLSWAPDGSGVYFDFEDQGSRNLHFVDLKGNIRQVTQGQHMLAAGETHAGNLVVAAQTNPYQPSDIVAVNTKEGSIRRLTDVNSDILDCVELGEVEEIWYDSEDGTKVQGWIVKPPQFDPSKKYPLVLKIHGGPHAMYNTGFDITSQLHASMGYVVLYTNPRGSTGYGYDFANAIQNSYPGKDYEDLMAGVDALIEKGYVDEKKMFVYGGSGGGVLTSWIVGHTDRFAGASVNYPVINWMSFVGTTDGIGWYNNFEKKPWEDPSEHLRRSPLMYVGNVKTPTMLMCGVNDLRTPISQTEEFYQALKVNKVPTVMIRFNDEFHGTSSKPSNFMRTVGYLHGWFGQYGGPDPARP